MKMMMTKHYAMVERKQCRFLFSPQSRVIQWRGGKKGQGVKEEREENMKGRLLLMYLKLILDGKVQGRNNKGMEGLGIVIQGFPGLFKEKDKRNDLAIKMSSTKIQPSTLNVNPYRCKPHTQASAQIMIQ